MLHALLFSFINNFFTQTDVTHETSASLKINLKISQVLFPSSRQQHSESQSSDKKNNTSANAVKNDLWNKGINVLQQLMQQPEFLDQLYENENNPVKEKRNLFEQQKLVNRTTIESFKNLATGEIGVTFRYPSGKTICARIRQPNPLDNFDIGSWVVLLNGCN